MRKKKIKYVPVKLNPFVSCASSAIESTRSHFPATTHDPHIIVRSKTVDPATIPIPIEICLWAVSVVPKIPDTIEDKRVDYKHKCWLYESSKFLINNCRRERETDQNLNISFIQFM